jgi:mannose-1-phosphate guanylyltransferase/mannose-6-phosphate isomerase
VNYAIILAGGTGSRFWPLSRTAEPKQFLNICSAKPMIEETIARISNLIKKENIYIATNEIHNQKIKNCIKKLGIPLKNIFLEPSAKNTLAPISILSDRIKALDSEAVIMVLPSDHLVKRPKVFLKILKNGICVAKQGFIVTLGIPSDRPETGYGYIKAGEKYKYRGVKWFYKVDRYIEKPQLAAAKKMIQDKRYYWNSGIFIFRPEVMLGEVKKFKNGAYKLIARMNDRNGLKNLWHRLPSISVDYAIMEKTKKIALLPANYGWMDIGSWEAVAQILKKDKDDNIYIGNCISLENENTLVWSNNRLVATLGLRDVVIVNTKDALLVCAKDKVQDVKKLVRILKEKNFKEQI